MNNKEIGALGEEAAARHLAESGMTLLDRNFRAGKIGEIDLIARDKDYWCFIEVKTRSGDRYGTPIEAVFPKKQQAIIRVAQIYLNLHHLRDVPIRFDVVEVFLGKNYQVSKMEHVKNAF